MWQHLWGTNCGFSSGTIITHCLPSKANTDTIGSGCYNKSEHLHNAKCNLVDWNSQRHREIHAVFMTHNTTTTHLFQSFILPHKHFDMFSLWLHKLYVSTSNHCDMYTYIYILQCVCECCAEVQHHSCRLLTHLGLVKEITQRLHCGETLRTVRMLKSKT